MYEYAKKYYDYHQNLEVPHKFKTNDGYTYDENGIISLGAWIFRQRQRISIESERGELLSQIGMRFETLRLTWKEMYEYAKKYYKYHQNLEVPFKFNTNDGYTNDENGLVNLGRWITNQRRYTSQESNRGKLLLQIGMRFENKISKLSWKEMYEYAKKYHEYYKNLEVPFKFKTNDGYTHDEDGQISLGAWISTQRQKIPKESKRGELLSQIGIRFENKYSTLTWEEMYEYAKKYYEHHQNLEVSQRFKTNDGYTYDENGLVNLGRWIINQRHRTLQESKRGELLSQIGMRFENKNNTLTWDEMHEYAKKYYEYYKNLEVPSKFKTNDGYTYDQNGIINLGEWIRTQRKKTQPESKRGKLLSQIGMIWNIKKNKEELISVCLQHNIDTDKNKVVLKHFSVQELESKIEYLKSHNIQLVKDDGILIDIFSMSSIDMKNKYGVSLEELITTYYDKDKDKDKDKGKGV